METELQPPAVRPVLSLWNTPACTKLIQRTGEDEETMRLIRTRTICPCRGCVLAPALIPIDEPLCYTQGPFELFIDAEGQDFPYHAYSQSFHFNVQSQGGEMEFKFNPKEKEQLRQLKTGVGLSPMQCLRIFESAIPPHTVLPDDLVRWWTKLDKEQQDTLAVVAITFPYILKIAGESERILPVEGLKKYFKQAFLETRYATISLQSAALIRLRDLRNEAERFGFLPAFLKAIKERRKNDLFQLFVNNAEGKAELDRTLKKLMGKNRLAFEKAKIASRNFTHLPKMVESFKEVERVYLHGSQIEFFEVIELYNREAQLIIQRQQKELRAEYDKQAEEEKAKMRKASRRTKLLSQISSLPFTNDKKEAYKQRIETEDETIESEILFAKEQEEFIKTIQNSEPREEDKQELDRCLNTKNKDGLHALHQTLVFRALLKKKTKELCQEAEVARWTEAGVPYDEMFRRLDAMQLLENRVAEHERQALKLKEQAEKMPEGETKVSILKAIQILNDRKTLRSDREFKKQRKVVDDLISGKNQPKEKGQK